MERDSSVKSCGCRRVGAPTVRVPLTQADAGCCRADDDASSHHVPRFPLSAPPRSRRAVTYHVAQLSFHPSHFAKKSPFIHP
ncbi:hypothetical protein CDAR_524961 [Caerostris darwini]|uniref:Uncharacterized protein n=1 Tax=Caerostris darwini TaxID=1538125 RepID=A0AAV4R020_9ARAC|nr:hypothetical protein CDAR_524961 [Caerostris darwini]